MPVVFSKDIFFSIEDLISDPRLAGVGSAAARQDPDKLRDHMNPISEVNSDWRSSLLDSLSEIVVLFLEFFAFKILEGLRESVPAVESLRPNGCRWERISFVDEK